MADRTRIARKGRFTGIALAVAGALLLLLLAAYTVFVDAVTPAISNVRVSGTHFGRPLAASFPYLDNSLSVPGRYAFDATLRYAGETHTRIIVKPHTCAAQVAINSVLLPLPPGRNYCDGNAGFTVELAPYLKPGDNTLHVIIEDASGPTYGLDIEPAEPTPPSRAVIATGCICGLLLLIGGGMLIAGRRPRGHILALLLCLLGSVLLRAPYFSYGTHIDEATFIVLGRDLLQGHLPYTVAFDNKPPLLNVIYGLFLLFAGSVPGVRFMMALALGFMAYILYRACDAAGYRRAGLWSAFLSMMLFSVPRFSFESSFGFTLSEQAAGIPLACMAYFLLRRAPSQHSALLAGLCGALAGLTRTNLLLALPMAALAPFAGGAAPRRQRVAQCAWFCAGVLSPYLLLFGIYAVFGHAGLLYRAMILAPFAMLRDYGEMSGQGISFLLLEKYARAMQLVMDRVMDKWAVPGVIIAAGLVYALWTRQNERLTAMAKPALLFVGIALSIAASLSPFPHFLLQLVVPVALLGGLAADALCATRGKPLVLIALACALLPPLETNLVDGIGMAGPVGQGGTAAKRFAL